MRRISEPEKTMFNLEHALAAWRRSLEHNRAFTADDREELERHVRDQVAALVGCGRTEEEAFRRAVREVGSYGAVEEEYQKVYWGKLRRRRLVITELSWRLGMFKNYLTVALRSLLRQKGYASINIVGVTLGLASCLLIFQYVAFEYSYDDFNENDRLYRVIRMTSRNGADPSTNAMGGYALGPALGEAVPEVVRFARIHPDYGGAIVSNPDIADKVFEEAKVFYADPAFLRMFTYPLVAGDTAQALTEPGTLLLSETAARRYFGDQDPLGRVLNVTGWISGTFRVNGVFQEVPANSHLQFEFLLPMQDLIRKGGYDDPTTGWNWQNFITYVELAPGAGVTAAEQKMTAVLLENRKKSYQETNTEARLEAQPLRDVYLNDEVLAPQTAQGSYRTVSFFIIIDLITFLIALINYVNLSTARALDRAREVGVRKVVGAHRGQLITQFLAESALANLIAVGLAVGLAVALTPAVNDLAGTHLTGSLWASPRFWGAFAATFCAGTLLAGLYPAFVLSAYKPVSVLAGKRSGPARAWLRQGLVVLQFAASVVLVAGTAVVYSQLDYVRHMDLGIDLEQILTVPGPRNDGGDEGTAASVHTFVQQLHQLPGVGQVATSSTLPGQDFNWYSSGLRRTTASPTTGVEGVFTQIDTSFIGLYGLQLIAGQGFARLTAAESGSRDASVILNETAVHAAGFDTPADAIDQGVSLGATDFRVVGVFRDFNWSSAHTQREAILFGLTDAGGRISMKVSTEDLPATVAAVERLYKELFPGNPFQYAFLDEQFDEQYRNDQRFAKLFGTFAGLAVLIACLGLFGMATFTARRRTKEIGIRKALGATVPGVVVLLSKDFVRLVLLGFVVAVPVAYLLMGRWLDGFAYHVQVGPGVFALTGALVVLIALLTVSYQAVRAALADPVKSLRYE